MRPIRVLDVITTAQGAARLLVQRAKAIQGDPDFENWVVAPESEEYADSLRQGPFHYRAMNFDRGLGPITVVREVGEFLAILDEVDPDVVHAHTSKAGAVARIACALRNAGKERGERILVLYQVHSFYFNYMKGIRRTIFLTLERILSGLTDVLLFQNRSDEESARAYGMGKKARLAYIGNGIDTTELPEPTTPRLVHRPSTILCVARVERAKNHPMLLRVATLLRERLGSDAFTIDCYGEVTDASIVGDATCMGLEGIVRFQGAVGRQELAHALDGADLSILCSLNEGKPRAVMESMLYGLPVVATDVCGTRELIADGQNGFLVEVDDDQAMTERLVALLSNPVLYTAMATRARDYALEHFSETPVIEALKRLYRDAPRIGEEHA